MDNWTGSDSCGTTATELQSPLVRRYTGLTSKENFSGLRYSPCGSFTEIYRERSTLRCGSLSRKDFLLGKHTSQLFVGSAKKAAKVIRFVSGIHQMETDHRGTGSG